MLNTIPSFYVPSLTERTVKERLLILEHILRKLAGEILRNVEVEESFLRVYFNYPWPKNLSELENALKFALSLDEETLRAQNLPDHIKRFSGIE
jgi:transcriptional regulator with AAA-type ATPase domain